MLHNSSSNRTIEYTGYHGYKNIHQRSPNERKTDKIGFWLLAFSGVFYVLAIAYNIQTHGVMFTGNADAIPFVMSVLAWGWIIRGVYEKTF